MDYYDIEWFALEMNSDHSVVFEIAPKYCILNSFVDDEDYSISSKGYLPTVVYMMVIWIICPFPSSLVPWFLECCCSVVSSPVWPLPVCLDSWTWHFRFLFSIVLYSIRLYFHHHNLALFPLWLSLFIPSGAISPVFSTLLQHIEHLPIWGAHLSVSYLFAFSYCPWDSQSKSAEVVWHSLLQWTKFFRTLHHDPSV